MTKRMLKPPKINLKQLAILGFLIVGIVLVLLSAIYSSYFLAILGVALGFWAGILLYIAPTKQISLAFLNAVAEANTGNIERILSELEWANKGIFLPPKNLKNVESSLIFIPKILPDFLPKREDEQEKLFSQNENGIFLTPTGQFFTQIFEQELKTSFNRTDLAFVQRKLPRLLIEELDIAESLEITAKETLIQVEITGHIFGQLCKYACEKTRTQQQVGCLLGSAFGCVLAKATGKAITIQNEICDSETRTTRIAYRVLEA